MANLLIIGEKKRHWQIFKKAVFPQHNVEYLPLENQIESTLKCEDFDVIMIDMHLKPNEGFQLLKRIRVLHPYTPVLAYSEDQETSLIVKAVKCGAFDFLTEPFITEKIRLSIEHALENRDLKYEIAYLRGEQDFIYDFNRIIARTPVMQKIIDQLIKFSQIDSTVLMTGDTGTGKSFLSAAVHFNSKRHRRPFIKVNCANIPETLLESELFGHEKGAFTGADKIRIGRLEQAKGGTIFFDELGETSLNLQAKFLRVMEDKTFERLGGCSTIQSDVRIIAATNQNLENLVAIKKFREDLFYRINVLRVHLPPLKARRACIEPLAIYFLKKSCRILKKKIDGFSPAALEKMQNYPWPGNIRQLANIIESAAVFEESNLIRSENLLLPLEVSTNFSLVKIEKAEDGPQPLHKLEYDEILKALDDSLWVQKDAAEQLRITPRVLNYKIRKYGITHPGWRRNK
jgi:DNA-binding NtrC family response regulator